MSNQSPPICPVCLRTFTRTHHRQLYDCKACKQKAWRTRRAVRIVYKIPLI